MSESVWQSISLDVLILGTNAMNAKAIHPRQIRTLMVILCLSLAFWGCSKLSTGTRPGVPATGIAEAQWYVREVTKGEVVPVEGPHQAFEVFGEPKLILVAGDEFSLSYDLPGGRRRVVSFVVQPKEDETIEVICPLSNVEPNADAVSWEDRRLNEAVSGHSPVIVAMNEWTTFFNDKLGGVFSSDWQLWWGDTHP